MTDCPECERKQREIDRLRLVAREKIDDWKCPICNGFGFVPRKTQGGDKPGVPKAYALDRCPNGCDGPVVRMVEEAGS